MFLRTNLYSLKNHAAHGPHVWCLRVSHMFVACRFGCAIVVIDVFKMGHPQNAWLLLCFRLKRILEPMKDASISQHFPWLAHLGHQPAVGLCAIPQASAGSLRLHRGGDSGALPMFHRCAEGKFFRLGWRNRHVLLTDRCLRAREKKTTSAFAQAKAGASSLESSS